MNRRDFLAGLGVLLAPLPTLERLAPRRVYSFPRVLDAFADDPTARRYGE